MTNDEIRVDWNILKEFTTQVLSSAGMPTEGAEIVADVLIWANLRGTDSHGVLQIPQYVKRLEEGLINPQPDIKILKETAAITFIDADRAFGPVVMTFAMNRTIEKAKQVGIGWTLIRNHTHQGAMGYYTKMAAEADMAGITLIGSPPEMAPYGAKANGLSNNPISIAVPAKRHRPLLLDMATSVAAGSRILVARD